MPHRPAARLIQRLLTLAAACAASVAVHAETVNIAVAANFTEPAKALAAVFQKTTGHTAQLSFGATGAFYSQIKNGAPFDVLMAAARPILHPSGQHRFRTRLLLFAGIAAPALCGQTATA